MKEIKTAKELEELEQAAINGLYAMKAYCANTNSCSRWDCVFHTICHRYFGDWRLAEINIQRMLDIYPYNNKEKDG